MTPVPTLPEFCGVAFKEWAGVCAALADGRQSLILRKGGIAEEAGAFVPEHRAFWLYPTHVHEAQQGLRDERTAAAVVPCPDGRVALQTLALVATVGYVDRLELLPALADLHVWTEETVRKRFHYKKPGLWVLGVRVFRGPGSHLIEPTAAHEGCKTWVPLDPPLPTAGLAPVRDATEFARRQERFARLAPVEN